MKRKLTSMATLLLAIMLAISACSGGNNGGGASGNGEAANGGETSNAGGNAGGESSGGKTKLEFWTFQQLHADFFTEMAKRWNEANPDNQIELVANVSPFDDVHNKLLVSLQSGSGAPDLADIELGKFPNFMKGEPQLVPLNDIVEPEMNNLVKSRFDIYAKDGNYYGVDYHVGASVIYYNKELLDKAGVNPDRKSTRLNSSHIQKSRMPSSA